jgi:amino acid adenylation domain-containing protein/thioester reductase-like protein
MMNTSNDSNITKKETSNQQNILDLFYKQTLDKNSNSRVFFNHESMSYKQLDESSDTLAYFLKTQKIKPEELACVLMSRSIEAIISKIGILKAGGAYLPMTAEDFPLDRICNIFDDAQVTLVITHSQHKELIDKIQVKLGRQLNCFFVDELEAYKKTLCIDGPLVFEPSQLVSADSLAYVMYTSGSTGKPKGVMISHQNIISSVHCTNYLDFSTNNHDAFLHAAPISFDAATFEIWGALLNGKDLYIAPETMVHDFDAFTAFMKTAPISIAWLTSALFNLITDIRPDFFQNLSLLLVGGEALSPKHINRIRTFYPQLAIRNNYGPTENTIFSTSFLIDKTYEDNIPIGHHISHKRAYILNKNLEKAAIGVDGELFVAGEGLSRGYLNLETETQTRFIPDPFFPGERMYATGDLCRYNLEGNIEFIGRIDKQVKVSGHRIELGEIETILQACPQVNQAVVLYKKIGAEIKGLAAYINYAEQDLDTIKKQISNKLPQYMIPTYFEAIDNFPLTINGKIDRKAISNRPIKTRSSYAQIHHNIDDTVLISCQNILGLNLIDINQSFFDLGGDSLLGTCLIVELEQQLDVVLPLQALYENPIISDLIQHIKDLLNPNHASYTQTISLAEDAQLDKDIQLAGRTIHDVPKLSEVEGNIFLTGGTGFFGAFLLKELLKTTKATIHCLVRADNKAHATHRISSILKQYKIPVSETEQARIVGIPGDLTQENLGLSNDKFTSLAQSMDVIFHNGASVNYVDTYSTLKGPNVFGTREILRLSCHHRVIPIHYISSVSVFETVGFFTGRDVIFESESVDLSEHRVQLGYSQSKWVAEKMMENARLRGLPINIYRSGYIMGHSETGVSNTTDHIARYIAGCIEMGCAPILEECASLAPVDQLSRALCYVALNTQAEGKTYHLCNPSFITVSDIYQKIKNFGFPLELLSYAQWKEKLKSVPISNPLYPLLSLHIHAAPNHSLTLPELYERNTRFDCSNLLMALKGSGIQIGLNDPALFERWLEHYLEAGLISEHTFKLAQAFELSA